MVNVEEAEKDNFLGQPAPEDQQANQNQHLDKKHVTKCGLLKVLFIKDLNVIFNPFHQHFLFDAVLPILFFWFLEVKI